MRVLGSHQKSRYVKAKGDRENESKIHVTNWKSIQEW